MAESAVADSITDCVGFGTKLAVSLYTFGDTVQSSRREINLVGQEITLFCAVLRYVRAALDETKPARFSTTALLTIKEIVERCREIFVEVKTVLTKLTSVKAGSGEPSSSLVAKVKWTFQRSRVQVLRQSIESFKTTLQLMLSTLDLSQKMFCQPYDHSYQLLRRHADPFGQSISER
jgi:hypothetical protein